jgi:tetratricopeptide (TPR) repeat protein
MEQSQIEYLTANKNDAQAKADFEQFRREKWEFELNEYNLWAENYPTETSFKFYAAERMFRLGQFEEAIPLFQNAEADAKFRTKARMYQGRAFFELKFYDEAVDTLDALVKEYPNQDDAAKEMRYWAARAHEDRGDSDVAIKLYSAIVRMEFNFKDVQLRIRKLRAAAGGNAAPT